MNIPRLIAVGAVAGALVVSLAACSSGPVPGQAASKPAAATSTSTPTAAAAKEGSRSNPFPVGTPGKYDSTSKWTFTWKSTDAEGWTQIQPVNQFNTPPAAGSKYVLGTVQIAADASMPEPGASPVASYTVAYVGSDGNTYSNDASCGVLPGEDFNQIGNMYAGATKDATVCATVPESAISGGTWVISAITGMSSTAYFKGA